MALIDWTEELSVGIKMVDEQHKELIRLLNELNDALKAGKGQDIIGRVLVSLVDYTLIHFGTEETLFETHQYPAYVAHKAEHDKLTNKVLELKTKLDNRQVVFTVEVLIFLRDWLQKHIMRTDKQYSSFLIGRGVS